MSREQRSGKLTNPKCYNFTLFSAQMKKVFDRSVSKAVATRRLFYMQQGASSVSDYTVEFLTLAATAGVDSVYIDWSVSDRIADCFITCETPA